jgi:ribosomal protein L11 methyltransferase
VGTPRTPRFPVLVVDVPEAEADLASAELFELGATGIEVRDATTLRKAEAGRETLVASFADEASARSSPRRRSPRVEARGSTRSWGTRGSTSTRSTFTLSRCAEGIVVRPPWEAYAAKPGERVLTLEPGRAFGTGLHETTSLVADVLAEHAEDLRGRPVLDVGTGSGILALVALVLGAERARAIDVDADAIDVARENAVANGFESSFDASTTSLSALPDRYPVILANIEASVLGPMAPDLSARAEPGALLVLSGILGPPASTQVPELLATYAHFEHLGMKIKGEWAALILRARSR